MKRNTNQEKQKYRGASGFDLYYGELFSDRWGALKKSLLAETRHASLTFPGCETYFMDPASICAALCLPLDDSENVLDLCAAPGGKTLVVSANLAPGSELKSNERSAERKNRLAKVVSASLPQDISNRIKVTCSDGTTLCQRDDTRYGSILLDAPCSSERHVLNDEKYLSQWSPARLKSLAMEQWALVSSAWRLLDEGGFLLYATCALSPKENDEIISRLAKKFSDAEIQSTDFMENVFKKNLAGMESKKIVAEIQAREENESPTMEKVFQMAEPTEHGLQILPDSSNGYGPLFFSLVKKCVPNPDSRSKSDF